MRKMNGKTYLTLKEIQKEVGLNLDSLRRLVRNGKIKAITVGKTYYVSLDAYESYLQAS